MVSPFTQISAFLREESSRTVASALMQVILITGDHVAIVEETCRDIGMGSQILFTKDTLHK